MPNVYHQSNVTPAVKAVAVNRHQGVILVATLAFLLLIGLLGLTSLDASITQEKMIGNAHHYNVASQSAETALGALENQLLAEGIGGEANGIQLIDVQLGSQNEFAIGNATVRTEQVDIGGATYLVTEKGGISGNPDFADSSSDWGGEGTLYNGIDYLDDSEQKQLSAQPKVLIEQGRFIPDDLSVEAMTEFRGRQEFIIYSQAVSRNKRIASVVQSSVLVRAQ